MEKRKRPPRRTAVPHANRRVVPVIPIGPVDCVLDIERAQPVPTRQGDFTYGLDWERVHGPTAE